jgi:hypothetical protein
VFEFTTQPEVHIPASQTLDIHLLIPEGSSLMETYLAAKNLAGAEPSGESSFFTCTEKELLEFLEATWQEFLNSGGASSCP